MAKRSKKRTVSISEQRAESKAEFSESAEHRFKAILKIMSWIVGICFLLIIILPNFDFLLVDEIVKFIFYLGVFNLLLFAVLEMFSHSIKMLISKNLDD